MIEKGSVVQFIEGHKWVGCLGIVTEDKGHNHPRRYMIGVPIPEQGTAYIFDDGKGIEEIGKAVLVETENEEPQEWDKASEVGFMSEGW